MRLLILAAAATLAVSGAAVARESVHHHHHYHHVMHQNTSAPPAAEGSIPVDGLGNHDAHMKNLHDSGYNPHSDLDSYGNIRQN